MYNLGKKKKAAVSFLYQFTLKGFDVANSGFKLASFARNEKDKKEFKVDCEMFSKTAKAIHELLGTTMAEREEWLESQDDFEKALRGILW